MEPSFVNLLLPSHIPVRIVGAMVRSALNEDAVNTYSEFDAISSSSLLSTPFPTPIAYTVTPLFLIPSEATTRLVYTPVLVCFPSVMTIAICINLKSS